MKVKKVKWTEFNSAGYQVAVEKYSGVRKEDFEKTYEGEVIDTFHPLIGTPRFVVALPDGEIKGVNMTACTITEFGE